jgi:hypothetical protein
MRLPGFPLYINGATIRCGLCNNGPHVKPTLEAVANGTVRPSTLWATQVDWEDLPTAYLSEQSKLIAVRPSD